MSVKEQALHWRTLARKYHGFGLNLIPLGSDKQPVVTGIATNGALLRFKWEAWIDQWQDDGRLFDGILNPSWWADVRGVAALGGPVSGGLIVLDGDHADIETARQHLALLGLPGDYAWFNASGSGDGWHCYVRCPDWQQDKAKVERNAIGGGHVELRWKGSYTALPGSVHPSGNIYPGDPSAAPQDVTAAALALFFDAVTIAPSKMPKATSPTRSAPSIGGTAYGLRALAAAVDAVRHAPQGRRNDTLNAQAKPMGELVGGGELDRAHVESELTAAALAVRLDAGEIAATLRSALDAGEKEPRRASDDGRQRSPSWGVHDDVTAADAADIGLGADLRHRPSIDVGQQTSAIVRQALQAVIRANEKDAAHPVLYVRAGVLARVIVDENGRATIEPVDRGALLAILAEVADWVAFSPKGDVLDRDVPLSVVAAMMGQSIWPGLPVLEGVTTHPVFGRNGDLHDRHGYDPQTRIFNAASVQLGDTEPTPHAVQDAVRLLLVEMLGDFPFVDDASRAHALALALLPVCRYMIDGATPLHLISAPTHGAGKSLLAEVALLPAYGREPAATPEA